jgi:hypothetical protein
VERVLPSDYYHARPWLGFNPAVAHLFQRPREIADVLTATEPATAYSPCHLPTYAPAGWQPEECPRVLRGYHLFASLRPWWVGQRHLPREERPIDLARSFALFSGIFFVGLTLMVMGCPRERGASAP